MDWLQNKTTQIIALVGIVGTLAGFGYTGAEYVNRLENLEAKIGGISEAEDNVQVIEERFASIETSVQFLEKAVDPEKKAVAAKMLKIANKPSGKKAVGQTIKQEKLKSPLKPKKIKSKAQGGLINRRYGGMIGNKSSGHNGNDLVAAGYTKIA